MGWVAEVSNVCNMEQVAGQVEFGSGWVEGHKSQILGSEEVGP